MMNESRERIRREREREKNTYTSPRLALRRVLLLAEGRQFREAAAILSRLGPGVLGSVATELPIDLLVESLPHSAHLLETLLNRLISLEISPRPDVQCDAIAWRLVALLGGEQAASVRASVAKLAALMQQYAPELKEAVDARRRQLDAAVHGLGTHGLTADSSGTLISLHVALKAELQQHVDVYKQALHKLEELSPVTISQEPASSSHQRLLSLSHADVERRLIDNKSLLTAVDKPSLQLPALLQQLAARVDADKQVMACVGQLRRTQPLDLSTHRPIAGILMSVSRGCTALLGLLTSGEPAPPRSPPDSLSDGYHSDCDDLVAQDNRDSLEPYAAAWRLARASTLPALSGLPELQHVPTLKYKIVFSVAVLSFRAAVSLRQRRLAELRALLGVDSASAASAASAVAAACAVWSHNAATYCLREQEDQVLNQVLNTLREYPSLAQCAALRALCAATTRAAWTLCVLPNPPTLHTDFTPTALSPALHTRLPRDARAHSDRISTFVWPALLHNANVVFKAVVLT